MKTSESFLNAPMFNLFLKGSIDRPTVQVQVRCSRGIYQICKVSYEDMFNGLRLSAVRSMALRQRVSRQLRTELAEDPGNHELMASHKKLAAYLKGHHGRPMSEKTYQKLRDSDLEEVFMVYLTAKACMDHPNLAVADVYGLEPARARTLVRAARKAHEGDADD